MENMGHVDVRVGEHSYRVVTHEGRAVAVGVNVERYYWLKPKETWRLLWSEKSGKDADLLMQAVIREAQNRRSTIGSK